MGSLSAVLQTMMVCAGNTHRDSSRASWNSADSDEQHTFFSIRQTMGMHWIVLVVSVLMARAKGQMLDPFQVSEVDSMEFKRLIDENFFAAIIDVRSLGEFEAGHIENATLVESLASFGTSSQVTTPDDLSGCEYCDLGVYCRSGGRARQAIEHLQTAGFKGRLYNGQGVSQWQTAGFPLVTGASTPALCATTQEGQQACELSYLARTGDSTMEEEEDEPTGNVDDTPDTPTTDIKENSASVGRTCHLMFRVSFFTIALAAFFY